MTEAVQSLGFGPSAVTGVRSAIGGDGRVAAVVPTVLGVTIALTAVITALTYQAGLDRLLSDPVQYGWRWDEVLEGGDEGLTPEVVERVASAPFVDGVTVGYRSTVFVDGDTVQLFAFDRGPGDPFPVILEGREPADDHEIALGGQTLARLGASMGDVVEFRGPQGAVVELEVVGRTVLPLLSFGSDLTIGEGGLVATSLVEGFGVNEPSLALVDLTADAEATALQDLVGSAQGPQLGTGVGTSGPLLTADLRSYRAVRRTPLLLASVLAVLGLGVLAHTVGTAVRRRRHELSVLRTLGFSGRDLRSSVRWSVLTMVAGCVMVATPLGIASGRLLWRAFASGLGVESGAVTPVGPIAGVVAVSFLAAGAFAVVPARQASRLRPASALRAE